MRLFYTTLIVTIMIIGMVIVGGVTFGARKEHLCRRGYVLVQGHSDMVCVVGYRP